MTEPPPTPDPFIGAAWPTARAAAAPGTEPIRRRRRRTSRRRLRRRRQVGIAMLIGGGLIVLGAAWILVTGLLARSELQTVRDEVRRLHAQIDAGDLTAARATAHDLAGHAHRAHWLTTGPVWALAADLPGGGEPLRTVRALTAQVDGLSHGVLPQLVEASTKLDPKQLRRPDGGIDLARIAAAAPALDQADSAIGAALAAMGRQPAHTWIGAVDTARSDLLTQLGSLGRTLHSADLAAHIAPAMLGQDGVKRYFVAFQNEAEARGTGGLPGAFAILRADHGTIAFERFESDSTLAQVKTGLDFGPQYRQLYGPAETTRLYANSNISPHFPYAAQIWIAMWRQHAGERLDGAIALDPTLLGYLLRVTGPAHLLDGTRIGADNVVALTQSTVYARFPAADQQPQRKAYLIAVAKAVSTHVLDSRASNLALVKAAGVAAGERRLLVYSTDPAVEAELAQTSLSGAIPRTADPYVGLSIVNDGGNKLDYYLGRALTWQRQGCGALRDVTVTVTLTNGAPASGLSPYVTSRSDRRDYPVRPGDNRLEVGYYATQGAQLLGVTVDGRPGTAGVGVDLGHPVFTVDLELPRGTAGTVVLHLREPAGAGAPTVLRQPLVRPLTVRLADARC